MKSSIERSLLLRPLLDVLRAWPSRVVRGSQVALVEGTDLILLECTDDSMENTAVVEDDEVLRLPVVRVDKLKQNQSRTTTFVRRRDSPAAQ